MTKREVIRSSSEKETLRLGRELAGILEAGDTLLLTGNLGAGKTALVRGMAEALEVESPVSSPTFTILHVHEPKKEEGCPLYHFDAYRLRDEEDFYSNGFDEYIGGPGIAVIEWGERVRGALPADLIEIEVTYGPEQDDRVFSIRFPEGRTFGRRSS